MYLHLWLLTRKETDRRLQGGVMMKKIISLLCLMAIMLSMSLTALAGSIPEDLLHSDDAQIFFAEVVYYHSDKENPDIELSPVKVVKGDVKTGVKLTYYNPNTIGDFKVKEGNVYLFTYFDENNPTDIFEVKSYDTSILKLKNVEGDMWMRFQKHLNNGDYEEAEQERRERLGLLDELIEDAAKLPPLENDSLIYLIMPRINRNTFYIFVLPTLIGFILGICLWKFKKSNILSGLMILVGVVWWSVLSQINTHGSEGPGLLALMYSLMSIAFIVVEVIKSIVRKIKTRS